ncbi:MAG: hypothetical protein AAGJ35_04280, partial [Myxococcota bacterium]
QEKIVQNQIEIGFRHRGVEKKMEGYPWGIGLGYAAQLHEEISPIHAMTYVMAVEKLAGIQASQRVLWLRTMLAEVGRIIEHCTFLGPILVEMGGLTEFSHFFKMREACYSVLDRFLGGRMQSPLDRIGGYAIDVDEGFGEDVERVCRVVSEMVDTVEQLIVQNDAFLEKTRDVGSLSLQHVVEYGLSGPVARASGLNYDIRRNMPYLMYEQLDFEVVLGDRGDTHDRLMVRLLEMRQSVRILEQCMSPFLQTQGQAMIVDVPQITDPDLHHAHDSMEGAIRYFERVYVGEQIPVGEAYAYVEGANGELGFYVVSEGSGRPQRCHIRTPSFALMQSGVEAVLGHSLEDAVTLIGSYNIDAHELER